MSSETHQDQDQRQQRACQNSRDNLIACLMRTDCVLKRGKTPGECIKTPAELPVQCQHLISNYADCKKGMLDMRRRFRGNHLSDKEAKSSRGSGVIGIADVGPETKGEK